MNRKTNSPFSPTTIGLLAELCVLNNRTALLTAGSIVVIVVGDNEIGVVVTANRPVVAAVVGTNVRNAVDVVGDDITGNFIQ